MVDWPVGFARVPDEDWTRTPLEELALKYDTVEDHGWYRNLDRTVRDLESFLEEDHILLDYSGGTGILASRLLEECPVRGFGILIVDSSAKFLRLALQKLGRNERMAFRQIPYLREEKRLQRLQEFLDPAIQERGVDGVVSTNAVHLYHDLEETFRSWGRILRQDGRLFVQSGNIGLPYMPAGSWIIDETVEAIHRTSMQIVQSNPAFARYRGVLADEARMKAYDRLRRKFFLPVRPIDHYVGTLERAGFRILEVAHLPIQAHVDQWYEFLSAYHEGVLGWIGGSRRVEGADPTPDSVRDRLALVRLAMDRVFAGSRSFQALWTYINAAHAPR